MSSRHEPRRQVEELLSSAGVPWRIIHGRRHLKIYVGPILAGILPIAGDTGGYGRSASQNTLAQVRRAIAKVKA